MLKYIKYKSKYLNIKGGSSNTQNTNIHDLNSDAITQLHKLIEASNIEKCISLINKGADINQADNDGTTPLLTAIMSHEPEIFNILIDKGADINQADNDGTTPLEATILIDNLDMFSILIKKNLVINQDQEQDQDQDQYQDQDQDQEFNIDSILMYAFNNQSYKICDFLLKNIDIDINIDYQDPKTGYSILHIIAADKYILFNSDKNLKEIVKYIISNGDINLKDKDGYTPLINAIISGNLRFICMLKGKKPIANYTFGEKEDTILHIAARFKRNSNGANILKYLESNFDKLKIIKNNEQKLYSEL